LNLATLMAYIFGLILLYIMTRLLYTPLRWFFRLLVNGLFGFALLWLVNWCGALIGLHIGLNPVTALVAGFLGIPGVVLLIALRYVFSA